MQVKINERHLKVRANELASKYNIRLRTARDTINATTQLDMKTPREPMYRRLTIDHYNFI